MFLVPKRVRWSREGFTQLEVLRLCSSFIPGGVASVKAGLLSMMSGHSCTTYLWTHAPLKCPQVPDKQCEEELPFRSETWDK